MKPERAIQHHGVWRRFRRNRSARFSLYILGLIVLIALTADILATDQPLYVKYRGNTWWPAFSALTNPQRVETITDPVSGKKEQLQFDITEWKELETDYVVWAPVPYAPQKPDKLNRDYTSPFDEQKYKSANGRIINMPARFRHLLGTDALGNDLLSQLIHGCNISMRIGILSVLVSIFYGVLFGAFAGYFGDDRLKTSRARWLTAVAGAIMGYFWGFVSRTYIITDAFEQGFWMAALEILISLCIVAVSILLFSQLGRLLHWIPRLRERISIPVDSIFQRFSEIFNSLPRLLIIVTIAAMFREKSIGMVIGIIGLSSWTSLYRYTRAEMLRTRDLNYIEAARGMGLPTGRIIFRHALPNAFAPVSIEVAFLVAASILAESSLSFLGIGVPDDVATWGSILSAGRQQLDAWWMVIFPGFAIFTTVLVFNLIGDGLREAMDKSEL